MAPLLFLSSDVLIDANAKEVLQFSLYAEYTGLKLGRHYSISAVEQEDRKCMIGSIKDCQLLGRQGGAPNEY